jgi:hypothetical protein
VFDSDLSPLADAVLGETAKPYIVVFTDTDDLNPVRGKAELYDGDSRALSIVLEIGVANAVKDPQGSIQLQFAATDVGMETACDVIDTQALNALFGNPRNAWSDLIKRFVYKVQRISRRRGGQGGKGVRFAARQITITCSTNYELSPGIVPPETHPVHQFIDLAKERPLSEEVDLASIIEQLLTTNQLPDWRVAQSLLGIDTDASVKLVAGETPVWETSWPGVPGIEDEEPAEIVTIIPVDQTGEAES